MPTYSYKCEACSHRYDAFQSMKEDPHEICPECKGKVVRIIGLGGGIVFKGKGFYVTDYRKAESNSPQNTNETNKSSEPKANPITATSKPESKA